MDATNLLFILSDQHTQGALGCYGHPVVHTPNLDRLAEEGTRFTNAYTTCPICVPARASLATGRFVHQTGNWDNAFPYDGTVPSWGHRLNEQGFRVDSIGKLHFRSAEDNNGFTAEIDPLHVVEGVGDIASCLRAQAPLRHKRKGILEAGPGESTYLTYDADNAETARRWLRVHRDDERPWVLFLSFVCPHPPYIAPASTYKLYPHDTLPLPPQWRSDEWPSHPAISYFRRFFDFARPFKEAEIRKLIAAYLGVCTYLDRQIGRVLEALEDHGLAERTRVIYTSDHGESLGARGLFGKFTMYEESAGIPLILRGAGVPRGRVVETPASFVDFFPTVLEAVGAAAHPGDRDLPGESLWQLATGGDCDRTVFSEYHAVGSCSATYMLRDHRYKYIHHVGAPPQLFDLVNDPGERKDLAESTEYRQLLRSFEQTLGKLLDPEKTDTRAKRDQATRVASFGGKEAVVQRGAFDNSPVPGEEPDFH